MSIAILFDSVRVFFFKKSRLTLIQLKKNFKNPSDKLIIHEENKFLVKEINYISTKIVQKNFYKIFKFLLYKRIYCGLIQLFASKLFKMCI